MNVHPRQLRIFLSLAQTLNFSRTAEEFHMTQPSLSRIVKELEEAAGVVLFERSTRHVLLTTEGAHLVPLVGRIVHEYDSGLSAIRRIAMGERHQVSIASLPSLATVLLPSVVQALEQRFDDVSVTVHDGSAEATIKRVLTRQVDFALASVDPSKPELAYEEILRDRFVLLSSPRLAAGLEPVMRLADLGGLPLISMTDASTAKKYMTAAFLGMDAEFRPKMQFDQTATIAGFVEQGVGIAVLPYVAIIPLLARGGFVVTEICDAPERSIGIVTRRDEAMREISTLAICEVRASADRVIKAESKWVSGASVNASCFSKTD